MAKKITKSTKSAKAAVHAPKHTTKNKAQQEISIIMQAGIVFVIVSAIIVCSYAFSLYL